MIRPQPKQIRQLEPGFLEFLRTQACVTCGEPPRSQASHLRSVGAGGSDLTACSMCSTCHIEIWHRYGPITAAAKFFETYGVNVWQAQSRQLAAYFSDPVVILKRANEIIEAEGELTPAMQERIARLAKALSIVN